MLPNYILLFIAGLVLSAKSQCVSTPAPIDYMITGIMELGNPA